MEILGRIYNENGYIENIKSIFSIMQQLVTKYLCL